MKRKKMVCVLSKRCNYVSRSSSTYSPPTPADTRIIFLPSKSGRISHNRPSNLLLHIHFLSLFSLSLFLILFVIIRWQKQCRLSDSDWLLDIESRKGRGSQLFHVRPLILVAGGPDGGVVNDGGCAAVSAPELYPFLSITVQVKQMIGFSQWGD